MYRHRLRPPSWTLAMRGRTGIAGAVANLFTKALGTPSTLAMRGRTTVDDGVPGVGYVTTAPVIPVWSAPPVFSLTEGVATTQPLQVTAPGYSITLAWVSPGAKPAWVTLNSGATPTISFSGAQVDANDLAGVVISATANGTTVNSAPGSITVSPVVTSLTITYSSAEGVAVGPATPTQYWQSGFTTKDGTIIDWGTSDHGHGSDNGVREYDPMTQTQVYVEPAHLYDKSDVPGHIGHQVVGADYGYPSQYDNLHYFYIPRLDSLVIPPRGQYVRGATGRAASVSWPLASRAEACITENKTNSPGWDGPTGWKGVPVVSSAAGSLFCPYGPSMTAGQDFINQYTDDFNPHQAWSAQYDCGIRIGGGTGGGPNGGREYMWVIAPAANFSVTTHPYVVFRRTLTVDATMASTYSENGRDGCVFVGPYVYWVGGQRTASRTASATFYRMDIRPHLTNISATITMERLTDAPFVSNFPLLRHDPHSNALLLLAADGVAMFDLRAMSWSTITPSAYSVFFGGLLPQGCVGDFVDNRVSGSTILSSHKKFYWRAGLNGSWTAAITTAKQRTFHSLKIQRPADNVSYVTIKAVDPETGADWGASGLESNVTQSPFRSIKHGSVRCVGTGANRRLYLWSGDWTDAYPRTMNGTNGYKSEGGATLGDDARQEVWSVNISDAEIATGTVRARLASNAYHNYPWTGAGGYSTVGGFGGVEPQRGPHQPDACALTTDGSDPEVGGQLWMGPVFQDNQYWSASWEIAGYEGKQFYALGQTAPWAPVFKWTKPGVNTSPYGVSGVPLGNCWTLPNQQRLQSVRGLGTQGPDWDIPISLAGATTYSIGWGRVNAHGCAYDSVNNQLITLVAGADGPGKAFKFKLYRFNLTPVGGIHTWTTSSVMSFPVKNIFHRARDVSGQTRIIPESAYTGLHMDWGDDGRGSLAMCPQLIGRKLFVTLVGVFEGVSGSYNNLTGSRRGLAAMFSIDVDSLAVEHIPFPENQPWWLRVFDGDTAVEAGAASQYPLTPAQSRSMVAVGNKLVLGPDGYTKIGVDPWIQVYDTVNKTWTSFAPPASNDWPSITYTPVAVPELGEVWLCGAQNTNDQFKIDNGLKLHVDGAGRRFVRFKVT